MRLKIKSKTKKNNIYNNMYFKDQNTFNKNVEILMRLISKDLGNFCKYYNTIKYITTYISYYHTFYNFTKIYFKRRRKLYFLYENEVIA